MNDRDAFERAFVAVTYLVGRREELLVGLGAHPGDQARYLSEKLGGASRAERARTLANELVPLAAALDARRLR